jgi:aconitate hydratase 2/2-methylisocitrate dehydratase
MDLIQKYKEHIKDRKDNNIPPLPLNTKETNELVKLLVQDEVGEKELLLDIFKNNISPGVDDSAYIKSAFLNSILEDKISSSLISKIDAIEILGTMLGGYNTVPLINSLNNSDENIALKAKEQLENTLLIYDNLNDVKELMDNGNKYAKELIISWANAKWFENKTSLQDEITVCVFKVDGETNTDDLSPASEAFTRSDIPLHAKAMLGSKMNDALAMIDRLKEKGYPLAYVGDVVGTGSSRKSAINSIQWHMGESIKGVPNKKTKGIVLGSTIAPIFFNTAQDSGALPIQVDVSNLQMGDIITINIKEQKIYKENKAIASFNLSPNTIKDEYKAGGRIPLIVGKALTMKAREYLKLEPENIFTKPTQPKSDTCGYTQAQKIVAKSMGIDGVRPGEYIQPMVSTVGSQDTTGPMTRDEIKELAALSFGADLFMQSFCHTAAYPKPSDIELAHTLPEFISSRSGVSLKPKDGVIHSWLNRLCLPDSVGTGGDSHTRFPIGISFPAGSGLVAFAGVTGIMPLNMPESVLVRFTGELQDGITLRDLVNAIPYYAIKQGLLTVDKKNKKNIFAGKILEIEGLEHLKVEQAFELSDASAERSAAACAISLDIEPVKEYINSNIALINSMIYNGYEDKRTLQRRADKMQKWLDNPNLVKADRDAKYHTILEINISEIKEPILACPNDPDDVATLSEILADDTREHYINEVFVGSCMTNIGHYRALGEILRGAGKVPTNLWIAPPTKMDERVLQDEGYYDIFRLAEARLEVPGCSLCMGNQARVNDKSVVFSTSTRNFDNRMGKDTKVYLGSAELAGVCALLGKIPTKSEYLQLVSHRVPMYKKEDIYKYLNFHLLDKNEINNLVKLK